MVVELVQIIEDEPEHASLLAYAFRKAHYKTSIAYDGWAGLEAVRRLKPVLVVLDVMLRSLTATGFVVCCGKILRRRESPFCSSRHWMTKFTAPWPRS